jgi:hypothetical protein
MSRRSSPHTASRTLLGAVGLLGLLAAAPATTGASAPLTFGSARITLAGTSNIHDYTASTTTVRVTRVELAPDAAGPGLWDALVEPGTLRAFEFAIPAASLSSEKDGLNKNMHKALKVKEHPEITYRLTRLEAREGAAAFSPSSRALRAIGVLSVAGVEKEVAIDLTTEKKDAALAVRGEVSLLMTDFGIAPPKALMGMLKTDPKVIVKFETVLAVPLT